MLTYETALRRFWAMHRTLAHTDGWRLYQWGWQFDDGGNRRRTVFINGDGNPQMEATAEGRLYNHSPRLACLPGGQLRKN